MEHAGKSSGGFAMAEPGRRTGCIRTQVQPAEATPPARQSGQSDGERAASAAWKDREYSADDLRLILHALIDRDPQWHQVTA